MVGSPTVASGVNLWLILICLKNRVKREIATFFGIPLWKPTLYDVADPLFLFYTYKIEQTDWFYPLQDSVMLWNPKNYED